MIRTFTNFGREITISADPVRDKVRPGWKVTVNGCETFINLVDRIEAEKSAIIGWIRSHPAGATRHE